MAKPCAVSEGPAAGTGVPVTQKPALCLCLAAGASCSLLPSRRGVPSETFDSPVAFCPSFFQSGCCFLLLMKKLSSSGSSYDLLLMLLMLLNYLH